MTSDEREPLMWVTSTSSWEEAAILSRLLPPAEPLLGHQLGTPPANPFLIVAARETAPSCDLMLREFGVEFDRDGHVRQRVDPGWIIAATVLFAVAPGKQDKQFRNVTDQLGADPQRIVIRVPFNPLWQLCPITDLPMWDFTPTPQGRGPAALRRRGDGIPLGLAEDFHRLMRHVRNLSQTPAAGQQVDADDDQYPQGAELSPIPPPPSDLSHIA